MSNANILITNFSKGELSPFIEGRPDLAAYFEGASEVENWNIMRTGGLDRRVGFRMVAEVKDSSKDTILLPFEPDVDTPRMIELGDLYARFYASKARLGAPTELVMPYSEARLRNVHYTQSVDVMFLFHYLVAQQKLSRVSDANWSITPTSYRPPATIEADTDISGSTVTLTPAAVSGTAVNFTASSAIWLAADVGRIIVSGTARAIITSLPSAGSAIVVADIIDAFPDLTAIPAGSWLLRGSPQATLDPDKKEPVGAKVTLTAGIAAFRAADVGKYIHIYAGVVKINTFTSSVSVNGELLSVMEETADANPAADPAGAWTLEVAAWSTTRGFSRTGEFIQGRLAQTGGTADPTTFFLSASDSFDNYAPGIKANNAIEYTMATRNLNRVEWLAENDALFVGTAGSEHRITSGKSDEPFGGDIVPLVSRVGKNGSFSQQPAVIDKRVIFLDRSGMKVFAITFKIEEDGYTADELTSVASHIMGTNGARLGPAVVATRPDPCVYYVTTDGELVRLTYYPHEKVIGFSRWVTNGTFEAVGVIPQSTGKPDQVWVITKRTVSGLTKRYVEVQDEDASELSGRAWTSLQTDCAKVYDLAGVSTTVFTGLGHLEGMAVDVILDGSYIGSYTVAAGQVTTTIAGTDHCEIGLHYASTVTTMRPAVKGQNVEGLPRNWVSLFARVYKSLGGTINGEAIEYATSDLALNPLFTGDIPKVQAMGTPDTSGKVTLIQNQPYPFTLLAMFGEIQFGSHA